MYITLEQNGLSLEGETGYATYTQLKSLSFAPETDVLGTAAPVNELIAEVITDDGILTGDLICLYDDRRTLWAQYWLTDAQRIDARTVRLTGRSSLYLLDKPTMPATYYDGVTVASAVSAIFGAVGYTYSDWYTLDASVGAEVLHGFCPEQSARERLLWVCWAAGAYIRSYFCEDIQILPVPDATGVGLLIPPDKTFWRPRVTEGAHVTAVRARAYGYEAREPLSGEKSVTDFGGAVYVYTTQDVSVVNPEAAPGQFPENTVSVNDVMLLDINGAASAATALARHHFRRATVELDVIDNAEYFPGQLVTVYAAEDRLYTGWITACAFRFGLQARATLTVKGADRSPAATLTVRGLWSGNLISLRRYALPVGYSYALENEYVDLAWDDARRVFRPLIETVSGTVAAGGSEEIVEYAPALILRDGVLEIVSVDEIDHVGEIG